MKRKTLLLSALALVALAQLFVPWQMISKQAGYAKTGTEFNFKTDSRVRFGINHPGASLAGKYIALNFEEDHIRITDKKEWEQIQNAYVLFKKDSAGFAKIVSVTKTKPENSSDWVRAGVWVNWRDTTSLHLNYPFRNYYIEDSNHKQSDSIIKYGLNDSLKINYLKIRIKENQFLAKDLLINGVPFKEMIKAPKKNQ
jgi:hypothetical protein